MNDEERNKKENRSKSISKRLDFPTLLKVSGTVRVVLHLDSEVLFGLHVHVSWRRE